MNRELQKVETVKMIHHQIELPTHAASAGSETMYRFIDTSNIKGPAFRRARVYKLFLVCQSCLLIQDHVTHHAGSAEFISFWVDDFAHGADHTPANMGEIHTDVETIAG